MIINWWTFLWANLCDNSKRNNADLISKISFTFVTQVIKNNAKIFTD